jgi:hypothetical protein
MVKREGKLYFFEQKDQQEPIIVLDRGQSYFDVQVYKLKESLENKKIEEEIASALGVQSLPAAIAKDAVEYWVEKRFGRPAATWKII